MGRVVHYFSILLFLITFSSFAHAEFDENETDSPSQAIETENEAPAPTPTISAQDKYILMQTELARYQIAAQQPWDMITPNTKYRMGKKYASLPALRKRLVVTGDLPSDTTTDSLIFNHPLAEAIKHFQDRHGLKADGILGSITVRELNVSPQERMQSIQVNMQRWVELSQKLSDRYVMVNIPDYRLYLIDQGKQVFTMKAIVGKPDLPTPEVSSRITRIILNPYWNVPNKIAAKDIVPKVRKDPYYLDDMHIRVFIRESSREVNKADIDWENVATGDSPYHFRQEPGDDNALGLVKFEFPNPYDVYLHDTPTKSLFDESTRALSHGCIRLEHPFDLSNYLLKDESNWDDDRVQTVLNSHETKYISIHPIPVFITYLTVWVDDNGTINYRDDIYQRDNPTL